MAGGISLNANMRSNLLSLQNISGQVSLTQNRLATGLKVNSAIDNPSSFYTAKSLNNRATDLSTLLDSMEQAVSTVKAANTALEAGSELLAHAAALANSTLDTTVIPSFHDMQALVGDSGTVVSNWSELKAVLDSGKKGNIVIYGNITAEGQIKLGSGQNLVGVGYYGISEPDTDKFSQITIDMEKHGLSSGILATSDNLTISDISIKAKTRSHITSNAISLGGFSGHKLHNFDIYVDNSEIDRYSQNPISSYIISYGKNIEIDGINNIKTTITSSYFASHGMQLVQGNIRGQLNIETIHGFGNCTFNVYDATINNTGSFQSTNLNLYNNSKLNASNSYINGTLNINDNAQLNISDNRIFYLSSGIMNINLNSSSAKLNMKGNAIFANNTSNKLNFNAVAGSSFSWNGKVYHTDVAVSDNTMTDKTLPKGFNEVKGKKADDLPSLEWLKEQNVKRSMKTRYQSSAAKSDKQYKKLINQYDELMNDASYKGINLLKGNDLSVMFNEDRSSSLTVDGADMTSSSLGLTTFDWQTQGDIAQSLSEIADALSSIRSFTTELGNNYSILTTRQNFTDSLINVLTEGADNLTLADMNSESATMLALQTRQQLAVNALSLASEATREILKLF